MPSIARVLSVVVTLIIGGSCTESQSCSAACTDLRSSLPSGSVTSAPGSNDYWASQIQAIQAACYAQPATIEQVATVIRTASKYGCSFAIRGHGHSDVAGASNIAGGIVLNLAAFTHVALSADKTYATVGAGSQWGDVYTALDPLDYTVVGGRETTVGVGGLTLGGGISYFSGQHGFACDNVLAYNVVLANGTALKASPQHAPDLYRALRGGGNNFAVVTSFDLAAYPYTLMQGGLTIWRDSPATQASQIAAFINFAERGQEDPHAAMFLSLVYVEAVPEWIAGLYYTAPKPSIPSTNIYKPFYTSQLNASRVASTQRTGKHASFATELGQTQPSGEREQFHTGTYIADADLLNGIFNIYREVVAQTQAKLLSGTNPPETFTPALAFQPIPQNILKDQSQRGGNVLGLGNPDTPRMLLSMSWPWRMPANDALFNGAMDEVVSRANALAKSKGLFDGYIYMNYARTGEAVIPSYGANNVEFLHQVSRKYDPSQVFQKLVSGGFKL